MALDSRFLDDLKSRFTLSDIVGRKVKLVRAGREFQGLCPFHNEKTPSFTVNDQKGFYHCFGCGQHGSVLDFVIHTEGLEFREAVERLANEAGVEMPRATRESQERAKAQKTLSEIMDTVATWYTEQLYGARGASALAYLRGRGISDATIKKYRLGYAPDGRTTLKEAMQARQIPEAALIETGMLIKPDSGPRRDSYDRFRDRVMFPIGDRQGRTIAFGGRALSKDAKAKYLNSPETSLFHKGATLYNWATARESSYKTGQVIVVEGYMDVIALGDAGIDHAVAPLGTALTEDQISHLWQMTDEPILAFDGDNAGQRAASRALDRALPMLKPGKSLRFMMMPAGQDPDDLIRAEGRASIDRLVLGAAPLVDMLWQHLTTGVDIETPERRAKLRTTIYSAIDAIQNESVKQLYGTEYKARIAGYFRAADNQRFQGSASGSSWSGGSGQGYGGARGGQGRAAGGRFNKAGGRGVGRGPAGRSGLLGGGQSALKSSRLGRASGTTSVTDDLERILMLTLVSHPELLVRFEEDLANLDLTVPGLGQLRNSLVLFASNNLPLDAAAIGPHLEASDHATTVTALKQALPAKSYWAAWPDAALSDALTLFEHTLGRYRHAQARRDLTQAEAVFAADMTEENYGRLLAAQQAFRELEANEASIDGYGLESNRLREG